MQLFVFVCWWASFRLTFESHRRQHSKTTGMSSGRQISRAYKRRSLRLPVRGLSEMVLSARRAEPEANKEGSRTALGRMGENEKHRVNDRFGTESSPHAKQSLLHCHRRGSDPRRQWKIEWAEGRACSHRRAEGKINMTEEMDGVATYR